MTLFAPEFWALWVAFALMAISAVVNARTLRVPNWLTLPALAAGLAVAALISTGAAIPSAGGGLFGSLAAAVAATIHFVTSYRKGTLGAGPLKMQLAFGAWVGCALPLTQAVIFAYLSGLIGFGLACAMVYGLRACNRFIALDDGERIREMAVQPALAIATIAGVAVPVACGWMMPVAG